MLSCEKCRGVLLKQWAFGVMVRVLRATSPDPGTRPRPLRSQELARKVRCPACHEWMDTHPCYGPGNVVIDTCARCKLLWLDYGELS